MRLDRLIAAALQRCAPRNDQVLKMIGSSLTHYRITAKLGQGGMGAVYRATDTKLDREVGIWCCR